MGTGQTTNVIHWEGAGWYAPVMQGDECHEWFVAGVDASYSEMDDVAWSRNLGTPALYESKPDSAEWVVVEI